MSIPFNITFLGAAGTVTGSKFLVEVADKKILIDCGLFQGNKELRLNNRMDLPVLPESIDFVFLTHGHLDHVGYLPVLKKQGFHGRVWATEPTLDIAKIILLDSAKIQESEAEKANQEGYSKHNPAKPLYTVEEAYASMEKMEKKDVNKWYNIGEGIRFRMKTVGHILGACFIELEIGDKKVVFSGDVGRKDDFLLYPPMRPSSADYLILESTYGNTNHPTENGEQQLSAILNRTIIDKKGTLIIPSFAVERTQTLMYMLWQLWKKGELPDVPFIMDSPMGADVLQVFLRNMAWHKLSYNDCLEMCKLFHIVESFEETQEWIANEHPKVVIAGAGMLNGGRVLSYVQNYIENEANTILLVGYQVEGTRGYKLEHGAKSVKVYGKHYTVNADIEVLRGLSAHADCNGLFWWLGGLTKKPKRTFLVHGEEERINGLAEVLKEQLQYTCEAPKQGQKFSF